MIVAGHCMLLYDSIHDVMRAEKALKQAGLWCDLVPTPRQLSSDCGMAIELECAAAEALLKVLGGPDGGRVHRAVGDSFEQL